MKPNTGRPSQMVVGDCQAACRLSLPALRRSATLECSLQNGLENLHQVLEFRRIFPISTPNDNHHRLLEDIEPMSCIEDPCCGFTQMDITPGPVLHDDADDDRVLFPWKEGLESLVIQLWDLKLFFERIILINVLWRANILDPLLPTIFHWNILSW